MKRRRRVLVAAAAVVMAAGTLAACTGAGGSDGSFTYSSATAPGSLIPAGQRKPAPQVEGQRLGGGSLDVAGTKGRVTLVNFWATWCGPCATELPQFDLLYRQVHAKGIDLVGVDTKDQQSKAEQFVAANKISFPVVFDQPGEVMLKLGNLPSGALPVTVLIDKQQRVAAVYVARLSDRDVEPMLQRLAAEPTAT